MTSSSWQLSHLQRVQPSCTKRGMDAFGPLFLSLPIYFIIVSVADSVPTPCACLPLLSASLGPAAPCLQPVRARSPPWPTADPPPRRPGSAQVRELRPEAPGGLPARCRLLRLGASQSGVRAGGVGGTGWFKVGVLRCGVLRRRAPRPPRGTPHRQCMGGAARCGSRFPRR